ncbi:MAG: succinate dehydrogenase, hydrophobic membrane anchor protein [Sphingomonadales bacterium 32-68-7]|nr:MAG: succinate dehydrogenase, hydrophobic membrane anchor protein [Sphingomonadales bacterium 12-68-11]OYX08493.1 MAG: succinate dehydrogenase, hydrophobic membrane anchor protein [Sphingomonadales bacterium 32-68-7]
MAYESPPSKGTGIGRVRGLGAAHEGTHHWVLQRYTAAGNFLTVTFLAFSLVLLPDFTFETVREWIVRPLPTLAMATLVLSVFWHARLGLQVLIEDYLHNPASKFAALLVLNLAAFGGTLFGLISLARILMAAIGQQEAAEAAAEVAGQVQQQIQQQLQGLLGGGMGQ